jgi:PST family polysaccharide transporter
MGYPLVGMLAFAAGAAVPLVDLFLGSGWGDVAPVFALLAIAGAFQTLSYVGNWVYLARALTGQLFWYSLVSLTIKIVCVVVGSRWGIVGVAAGYAIAPAIAWPISLWWLSRLTPLPVRDLTFGALRITAAATVAGLSCLLVVSLLSALPLLVEILAGALTVALVYLLAAVVVRPIRSDLREVLLIGRKALKR